MTAAAIVILAVVLAACGGDEDVEPIEQPDGAETAAPPEDEPPPDERDTDDGDASDDPDDPYAVPDDIDDAYAQSVINEVLAVRTEALREVVRSADSDAMLSSEVAELVAASHSGPERVALLEEFENYLRADNLDEVFLAPDSMSSQSFELLAVVEGSENCIVATGLYDLTGTTRTAPPGDAYTVFSLAPREAPAGANDAPWTLHDQSSLRLPDTDEAAPRDTVAEADLTSFDGLIDDTCSAESSRS